MYNNISEKKIFHFNTLLSGGASIAAQRLFDSLEEQEIDGRFIFSSGIPKNNKYLNYARFARGNSSFLQKVRQNIRTKNVRKKLNYAHRSASRGYELFSYSKRYFLTPVDWLPEKPDLIHLHWIAEWLDFPSFFNSIPDQMPIVWTLHDMNPFTGGCHYAWECSHFTNTCHCCPQLDSQQTNDLSSENQEIKRNSIANKNIHVVADSHWLEQQARKSSLFKNVRSFQTIYYGIDIQKFYPKDKKTSKSVLDIETNSFTIAFGAESFTNKRKGFVELIKSLSILYDRGFSNISCLVFGHGSFDVQDIKSSNIKILGAVNSADLQSIIYSAADLFIIPSIYEAFGQTCLESMACGTPVVGFDTGGIPEMIISDETGLLAEVGNVNDLADKIEWMILNTTQRVQMGAKARKMVEDKFRLNIQAEKYTALYKGLL